MAAVGLAATIFIRSYNNFGVPAPDLAVAREHAQAILQEAGVNVVWIDCWAGGRARARRHGQPVPGAGRLPTSFSGFRKPRQIDGSRFVSMGFSLVGIPGAAPFLATVYADRAESVARGAGIDPRRVLGLAIAHEIGHVLLNSNSHAASGIDACRLVAHRAASQGPDGLALPRNRSGAGSRDGAPAVTRFAGPSSGILEPVQVLLVKPRPSNSQRFPGQFGPTTVACLKQVHNILSVCELP